MKINQFYSVLVLLLVVSTSCKRDHTCGCSYTQSQFLESYKYTIHDTKDRAEYLCDPHLQNEPTPDECVLID